MHILELNLTRFMAHEETSVTLPARGVVLVTGSNGAGKSGIVEGVSYGLWGRTLRGTSPWRKGEPGAVSVLTDAVLVNRGATKAGKVKLAWAKGGARTTDAPEYANPTKAQEALEAVVGDFEVWRRTHVFSSADAAHFTLATDGERKRLLESILKLEKFDEALEACRGDLRKAEDRLRVTEGLLARHRERLAGTERRLDDAVRALAALPPLPAFEESAPAPVASAGLDEKLARLCELERAVRADINRLSAVGNEQSRLAAEARAEMRQLEQGLARLKSSACPTCGQTIPDRLREEYREDIEAAKGRATASEDAATEERRAAEAQIVDLTGELADLGQQRRAIEDERLKAAATAAAARRALEERVRLATAHKDAQKRIEDCQKAREEDGAEVARLEGCLAEAAKGAAELQAVEGVLGLKGVRAHVLGSALAGLEQVANGWLARIAGAGLALKLRPYSEKKTGGISDAISLEIEGAGGGLGYKASSGGERRRLDVALLLALAEVARVAHGQQAGTLFFDEVFDALDADGIASVSEALGELAKDRAVVVISHSASLATSVPVALRLRVEGGALQE